MAYVNLEPATVAVLESVIYELYGLDGTVIDSWRVVTPEALGAIDGYAFLAQQA